jgi:hypothetical protein
VPFRLYEKQRWFRDAFHSKITLSLVTLSHDGRPCHD